MYVTNNHKKKPITANAAVFFKHLFPISLFERINKAFGIDTNRKKIIFRTFCIFLIIVVINQPQDTSLRGLESASTNPSLKLISNQESISHTAIAERLKSVPSSAFEMVLQNLIKEFKKRLKYKSPFLKGMKVFDVTTFSVSAKHYAWAAKKQSRGNVRFLFVMDSYSGTPDAIVDASKNLNDNKVFNKAISVARNGRVFVFDKGFNSFKIFREIIENGQHFITRWKSNYQFNLVYTRKLNPKEKLEGNWLLESDEVGLIDLNADKTPLSVRKIICRNTLDNSTFTILTDERNWAPNKIVTMYVYRWPIEVLFRHIKSNMHVIHFPSHDPEGVKNWMIIIMLSFLIIQYLNLEDVADYKISLMSRNSSFKDRIRRSRIIFSEWILIAFEEFIQ